MFLFMEGEVVVVIIFLWKAIVQVLEHRQFQVIFSLKEVVIGF